MAWVGKTCPVCGWAPSTGSGPRESKSLQKAKVSLQLSELACTFSSVLGEETQVPWCSFLDSRIYTSLPLPLVSGLWPWTENYTLGFRGFEAFRLNCTDGKRGSLAYRRPVTGLLSHQDHRSQCPGKILSPISNPISSITMKNPD